MTKRNIMKFHFKTYTLILTLFLTTLSFASSGKDSLAIKSEAPKVRTYTNESNSTHIQNYTTVATAAKASLIKTLNSRTFKDLDTKIENSYFQNFQQESEFTPEYLEKTYTTNALVNEDLAKAIHAFNRINETGNFITNISPDNLIELPVGLKKTINTVTYMVGISNLKLHPEYTELTAFVKITTPQIDASGNQREIFFGADNVKLSHDGGIIGEWNLVLLGDFVFGVGPNSLVRLKGGFDMNTGNIDEKCYVTIDCNGFKELHLEAEVQFSRNILEPLKEDYTIDNSEITLPNGEIRKKRVSGEFEITVEDWNNVLVQITLPRFQMTSFKGTAFTINTAVFDFSDTNNSENMTFPPNYEQYLIEGNHEAWRGVYVQSLQITLPEAFQRRNSDARVQFNVANLLIDGMGVSGEFAVDNVLPLEEGVAHKWQFSVDSLKANIVANSLTGASFNGKIVLPISKEITAEQASNEEELENLTLSYTGTINPVDNEYILNVSNVSDINFDIWKARATITENSYVELALRDGKFKPKAVLHGLMYIKADNDENVTAATDPTKEKTTIDFPVVTFQELTLQTDAPFLSVAYMGYSGTVKLANFPVTLSDINLKTTDSTATLSFNVGIHFMKDKFNGETGLGIQGTFAQNEGLQKWKFKKVIIDEVKVEADLGGVKFKGYVRIMDNDPKYGDGFMGGVEAQFGGLSGLKIASNAIFGKKDFRYWYVDGLVDNLNIPVSTGFKIKGFLGGAYHRMKKSGWSSRINTSGTDYEPHLESGLGIKAMLLFATIGSSSVFNGGLGYEIAFTTSGGIKRIGFYGEGHMLQSADYDNPAQVMKDNLKLIVQTEDAMDEAERENMMNNNLIEAAQAIYPYSIEGQKGINGYVAIEYDFTTSTLHGEYQSYLDIIGGLFRGVGENNRAGWAVLHFAPDTWYVHVGTPTDRIGIKVGIGSFTLQTGAYFMVGDYIPAAPAPPPIVAQILGVDADVLDYMRDENALSEGRGVAFGSSFSVDTGEFTVLIFYARLQAGIGTDIMVRDYGEAECRGSGQVGINGWYANGQSYAYLQGEIGIKLNLLFIKKKIPILTAGAAVLMQTKLPNPTWFRGYVGGRFSVLGGLVKGNFRIKVELGHQCEFLNGAPLDGLKIIADINPIDNSSNVDVFTISQVGFNMKVNEPFEFEDDEGLGTYRINLKEFKITDNGSEIPGTISWNANKDLLSFTPSEILPPETQLNLTVTVSFDQLENGTWKVMKEGGKEALETETRTFTTGVAPDYIPLTNVVYSYPVIDQKYFYKNEYENAYVKLRIGQSYLFNVEEYNYRALFETSSSRVEKPLSYNTTEKKVSVALPSLSNTTAYTMKLQSVPPASETANLNDNYTDQNIGQGNDVSIRNASLSGAESNAEITEMLSYSFSTSNYNTFQAKMEAKNLTLPLVDIIYSDVHSLEAEVSNTEPFESIELDGDRYTDNTSLIQIEAVLDDAYFMNEIQPLIYQGYPLEGQFTVDRDPTILGLPPVKAVEKLAWYQTYLEYSPNDPLLRSRLPFRYYLAFYYKQDFIDIQYKIVNSYLQDPASYPNQIATYDYIINGIFPYLKPGNYKSNLSYKLPGGQNGTSKTFTFNRPN